MEDNQDIEKISKEEVWNVLEFATGLYSQLKGFAYDFDYYNSQSENKLLVSLNNNPQIPTQQSLKDALANYKDNAELLQDYSEFMRFWDGIYAEAIDYRLNLLAFDINKYCINIKDPNEYSSKEYKDDCKRINKFFQNFNAKQEFRNAVKNMLITDTYFVWLRDSVGSFDEEAIDIDNEDGFVEKKIQSFALQTMPQKHCKITGEFTSKGVHGYNWDFDLNYFTQSNVNILNYDPSLIKSFDSIRSNKRLKNFIIDNNRELNASNGYDFNSWVRTKVNCGAWVFKYDSSNFNAVPPLAYLLKSVFNDDLIEKLQTDKNIISANAIILGEMKTRDKENVGNNKNAFTIDPKQVGQLMHLARKGINSNIKQIALPLEETRLYQFADNNSNMYKNQLSTSSALGGHNSSIIYSTDSMSQEQAQIASTIDYNSIANSVYPQFEAFLNFFVNKKTKKYKFRFKVGGSTLQFLRQKELDNYIKFMDKGIQIPPQKIGTLLGCEGQEFEAYMQEAKYGDMRNNLFLLLNTNTSKDGSNNNSETTTNENGGRPLKDVSDLANGSHEYK